MTFAPACDDCRVAQFARSPAFTSQQPPAFDNSAADPGPNEQRNHIGGPFARAVLILAPRRSLHIIDHDCAQPQRFIHFMPERYVSPFQIGSESHCTGRSVNLARHADADSCDWVSLNESIHAFDDGTNNRFGSGVWISRMPP
jgi:hypothetical protein